MINSRLLISVLLIPGLACNSCGPSSRHETRLPFYNSADFTPVWLSGSEQPDEKFHCIGDFAFRDQNNELISSGLLKGRIQVVNFFFTGCSGICPLTQHHFKILQDSFATDSQIQLLSFSVTPWNDNCEVLQKYAHDNDIDGTKWHLLTGSKDSIYNVARKYYFAELENGLEKSSSDFLHTEHCILVDGNLHIRGIYNGTLLLEVQRLISDIRQLEKEG